MKLDLENLDINVLLKATMERAMRYSSRSNWRFFNLEGSIRVNLEINYTLNKFGGGNGPNTPLTT
jgi:hypothetical protein